LIQAEGVETADSIEALIEALPSPKSIWLMVTSGEIVDLLIDTILPHLQAGDLIIDGGNSFYKDTMRRYERLKNEKIGYVDVGTSGGISGARNGACFMVGGEEEYVKRVEGVLKDCAVEKGYAHVGGPASGHYVKMIHNGIEYGMMQAIGEGFEILKTSTLDLDLKKISKVWANGSIIEGLLMDMVVKAFDTPGLMEKIHGRVDASGEGEWTVREALDLKVFAPIISTSLGMRFKSKDDEKYSEKVVAAMRNAFGGHAIHERES
jgi:6-phosphogluconate dehydrogenase